jgi:hypothetical protein
MKNNDQYSNTILPMKPHAAYTIAVQISPFLVRNGGRRRRCLPKRSTLLYSSTREVRTHVATAVL